MAWKPVYLDEVSIVLVRRKPETEDLIRRFAVNCMTAPIPREPLPLNAASFTSWSDAARVLSALGRTAEALTAIDNAVTIAPDSAHAHWYRGQIQALLHRDADAEEDWKKAIALAPKEVTPWGSLPEFQGMVWYALADMYRRQDRYPEAMQALENCLRLTSDTTTKLQAMANLGALEFQMGQTAKAEKQWLAAVALSPENGLIWTSLGDLYMGDKRYPEALNAIEKAVQYNADPATKANEAMKLARLYVMSHQPQAALQALDQAEASATAEMLAESNGRSFKFNLAQGRAVSWMAAGDMQQAATFAEQAVKLDPQAADAWSRLAKVYERQGRTADQKKAEEQEKAAQAQNPRS
jgi:tetratricopeptide (TPR) repeat protein